MIRVVGWIDDATGNPLNNVRPCSRISLRTLTNLLAAAASSNTVPCL